MTIHFGTSGWRGIIGEEITDDNVRRVAAAVAGHLKEEHPADFSRREIAVGYDTRFLSDEFAHLCCRVLCGHGFKVLLSTGPVPAPALSFHILKRRLLGSLNVTASHNPYMYNGIKYSPAWGGPALPKDTRSIERRAALAALPVPEISLEQARTRKLLTVFDPAPDYLQALKRQVDFNRIRRSKVRVGLDLVHSSSRGYLDKILEESGCLAAVLHAERDVYFGGKPPEPNEERLQELSALARRGKIQLGVAVDPDSDRFGIIDSDGKYLSPNEFLSLALRHLAKTRGWKGVVARSVMTTHLIDAVARRCGMKVAETPVGFKFIGEVMAREGSVYPSRAGNFVMGAEESGGFALRGHIPEKDGLIACLIAVEIMAANRKPFSALLKELYKEVGPLESCRVNLHLAPAQMGRLKEALTGEPPTRIEGIPVDRINDMDGRKIVLVDGSWMGLRASGTEPVARIYAEASERRQMLRLLGAARKMLGAAE